MHNIYDVAENFKRSNEVFSCRRKIWYNFIFPFIFVITPLLVSACSRTYVNETYINERQTTTVSEKNDTSIISSESEKDNTSSSNANDTSANNITSSYIINESDSKYLAKTDISNLTVKQLNYAKNEIYARHGRIFLSQELNDYFNTQSWYKGLIQPNDFSDNSLNGFEKANIKLLSDMENSLGGYHPK